ncbi:Ger(x)C family spore germination protein [Paenibacillus silvisoli]|uniref:Ger(x)C family spore germination protein n=1 Tax=Paenibacillus silvisoli TaxID=3110539 RepID=UPI0028047B2B|nr:Ger(x)C family spore germination protein [Paenibacillus silvisoli]
MIRWLLPALIILFLLLTGCDKAELTEFGYVQAIAIDRMETGKVAITTLFYNPSGGGEQGGPKENKSAILIETKAPTLLDAIRDIPIVFGRKAKWDHMRIILISEEVARKQNNGEILDFFLRDHEPRSTVPVLLAKGKASDYLSVKPFIENTIGQQLKRIEDMGARYSAKTIRTRILDLAIELKNETGVARMPYLYRKPSTKNITMTGIALLKEGKVKGDILNSKQTQSLVILLGQYESGILEIPCSGTGNRKIKESVEAIALKTSVKPIIRNKELTIRVNARIKGSIGQLICTSLMTEKEVQTFKSRIEQTVESDLRDLVDYLQQRQMDAIGIGDRIYRSNPKLWKMLKPEWGKVFAEGRVEINVKVDIINTGMSVGKSFSKS